MCVETAEEQQKDINISGGRHGKSGAWSMVLITIDLIHLFAANSISCDVCGGLYVRRAVLMASQRGFCGVRGFRAGFLGEVDLMHAKCGRTCVRAGALSAVWREKISEYTGV